MLVVVEDGHAHERAQVHTRGERGRARARGVRRDGHGREERVRRRVRRLEARGGAEAVDEEVVPTGVRRRGREEVEELEAAGLHEGERKRKVSGRAPDVAARAVQARKEERERRTSVK